MKLWLAILLITASVCLAASASIKAPPSTSRDQLHHPLYRPAPNTPYQHPRKGETCKDGVCTKLPPGPNGCPECQYALPLDFTDDQFV
ncbi:uncharacterized protein LOC125490143 isoform X2 [Plutella xylostella]|uniref:uncharacterized protein LOC125490143 isoform X2 n=1 Tax=Plutella xylostella TaxID=51655 RepID=UPI002032C26B|nr:uncharacterized protein LOC125490143 isoform X2 [Plutella xylostella]